MCQEFLARRGMSKKCKSLICRFFQISRFFPSHPEVPYSKRRPPPHCGARRMPQPCRLGIYARARAGWAPAEDPSPSRGAPLHPWPFLIAPARAVAAADSLPFLNSCPPLHPRPFRFGRAAAELLRMKKQPQPFRMKKQPAPAADSLPFLDAVPAADPENVPAVASVAAFHETAPAVAVAFNLDEETARPLIVCPLSSETARAVSTLFIYI